MQDKITFCPGAALQVGRGSRARSEREAWPPGAHLSVSSWLRRWAGPRGGCGRGLVTAGAGLAGAARRCAARVRARRQRVLRYTGRESIAWFMLAGPRCRLLRVSAWASLLCPERGARVLATRPARSQAPGKCAAFPPALGPARPSREAARGPSVAARGLGSPPSAVRQGAPSARGGLFLSLAFPGPGGVHLVSFPGKDPQPARPRVAGRASAGPAHVLARGPGFPGEAGPGVEGGGDVGGLGCFPTPQLLAITAGRRSPLHCPTSSAPCRSRAGREFRFSDFWAHCQAT